MKNRKAMRIIERTTVKDPRIRIENTGFCFLFSFLRILPLISWELWEIPFPLLASVSQPIKWRECEGAVDEGTSKGPWPSILLCSLPNQRKELVLFLWLPLLDMEQENTFVTQMISDLIQLFIEGMPYTRSRWAPGYLLRRLRLEMIMSHFLITTEQNKVKV